jgi:hypothetical protein
VHFHFQQKYCLKSEEHAAANNKCCDVCSCFCDAHQGFASSSTRESFCISFYAATTTMQAEPLVSVIMDRNSASLFGEDFTTLASQSGRVTLPLTYFVKVQGSIDLRTSGYYTFCVTSCEPAKVRTAVVLMPSPYFIYRRTSSAHAMLVGPCEVFHQQQHILPLSINSSIFFL